MGAAEITLGIVIIVMSVFLIAMVLLQSGKDKRLSGTIAGGSETYYGKDRAKQSGKSLYKWTLIASAVFALVVIVVYIAVVNSVNLIDGLDGLCSSVSSVFLLVLSIVLSILSLGYSGVYFSQVNNIIILLLGAVGAILGFICFNGYPAKIFMGDTGSLAIGGLIAAATALTRQYFLMCIIGVLYVLTAMSVVIQVVVFKLTNGKRVFKMSPLHHHFEVTYHEAKITTVYAIVTIVIGVITIALYL